MALFEDASGSTPRHRRRWPWFVAIGAFLAIVGSMLVPMPYVIDRPGPVFDTLGSQVVTAGQPATPIISISGAKTYPTTGELNMLTVSQVGSPDNHPNWVDVLSAWFDPTQQVLPMDQVFPPGTDTDQQNAQDEQLMVDSQQDAIAAALTHQGYDVTSTIRVASILDGSNATGKLKVGDEILVVNGVKVSSADQVRAEAAKVADGGTLDVTYRRDGVEGHASVSPMTASDGTRLLGVGVTYVYEFPIDVTISLSNVGGPSAGMMFALAIIDNLTPGSLTGGHNIAGTGTIDISGEVGAIGGIQQKLVGASRAGAEFFLAPSSNCDEVVGHEPSGMSVVSVSTLDDALTALDQIAAEGNTSGLPTCGG